MADENDKGSTSLRLTPQVLTRADGLIGHLAHMQGRSCTRSDVLREAIAQGLRVLEQEQRTGTGGGGAAG